MTLLLACAQQPASPLVVELPETRHAVELGEPQSLASGGGLELSQLTWTWQEASGKAWVVELNRDAALGLVPATGVQFMDAFVELPETGAAINGAFYENGGPMGLVRVGGVSVSDVSPRGGSGILFWGPSPPLITHRDLWDGHGDNALQSIDRLVDGGTSLVQRRDGAPRAARSAVLLSQDRLSFVVAAADASIAGDGRDLSLRGTVGQGLPLWAFADLAVALGAGQALNMDGAISSGLRARVEGEDVLVVRSEAGTINALVTHPR